MVEAGEQSNNGLTKSNDKKSAVDLISADENFVFLYKKLEKLAAAIFLITNLMSENDPIRLSLRKKAVHLISLFSFSRGELMLGEDARRRVASLVVATISHIDIGFYANLISEMNASILRRELTSVLEKISQNGQGGLTSFPKDFFVVTKTTASAQQNVPYEQQPIASREVRIPETIFSKKTAFTTGAIKDKKKKPEIKSAKRRELILTVIRQKGVVSIKDISFTIRDCSEKTLQRELSDLVISGVLKKDGEKRWTRYRLV